MEFIYRGKPYKCSITVLPKGPLGCKRIHSYTRMASFIRTRQSDLFVTRSWHIRRGNLWVQLYPRMKTLWLIRDENWHFRRKPLGRAVPPDKNLSTCAPLGLEPLTYHILGPSALISAPRSKELSHQDLETC